MLGKAVLGTNTRFRVIGGCILWCCYNRSMKTDSLFYRLFQRLPPDEWLNFIETILVYKLPHLTREEIKQMIGIQDIDLRQTRFYQAM
jgi:predicted transposase YdaD